MNVPAALVVAALSLLFDDPTGSDAQFWAGRRKTCPRLNLVNGRVKYKPRIFAQFTCNRGFILMGDRYSKCQGGEWDNPVPACIRPSCKIPDAPQFGMIYTSYRRAVIRFFCNANYELHGPAFSYCDGEKWSAYLPSCVRTNATPSVSCDFEEPDLCGWSHSLNHDFTWERMSNATPSRHIGTGPSYDHTKGRDGSGYYMYIESSYKNENDTARLISPVFPKQPATRTCLEFYYHMYGSGIGHLRTYVKSVGDSWNLTKSNLVHEVAGNQGDIWLRALADLGLLKDDFQVIFEGIRGVSYVSDIAIDDVRLIEDCKDEEITTIATDEARMSTIVFESCQNRCFKASGTSSTPPPSSSTIGCDCTENCSDNNTCCPDFPIYCIIDYTTTGGEDTTLEESTVQTTTLLADLSTVSMMSNKTLLTTVVVSPKTVSSTEFYIGKSSLLSTTTQRVTTTPKTTQRVITTPKMTPKTTQKLTTTSKATPKTTQRTITTSKTTPKTTQGIVTMSTTTQRILTTPKTTQKATTPKITQESTSLASGKLTDSSTSSSKVYSKIYYFGDVVTFPTTKDDADVIVDKGPGEMVPVAENKAKPDNSLTVKFVIVGTVAVFIVLAAVFALRRFSVVRCLKMKKMRNANGDSQSDVRFLTGDEILDFTLATPGGRRSF